MATMIIHKDIKVRFCCKDSCSKRQKKTYFLQGFSHNKTNDVPAIMKANRHTKERMYIIHGIVKEEDDAASNGR